MDNEKKIYKSSKQSIIQGTSDKGKIVKGLRTICIEDNQFTVELPNNPVLKGNLIFQSQEAGKTIFMTDKECPFVISDDTIFLNLYGTHDFAITFFIDKKDNSDSGELKAANSTLPQAGRTWLQKLFGN